MSLNTRRATITAWLIISAVSSTYTLAQKPARVSEAPFSIYNSTDDEEGRCVCYVQAPSKIECSGFHDPVAIGSINEQVMLLTSQVEDYESRIGDQKQAVALLNAKLDSTLDTLRRLDEGRLVVTRQEFDSIRLEILGMETTLIGLEGNRSNTEILTALMEGLGNVSKLLAELERHNQADTMGLLLQVEELKAKLRKTEEENMYDMNIFSVFDNGEKQDSCRPLREISLPHVVRYVDSSSRSRSSIYPGSWFRDSLANETAVYYYKLSSDSRYTSNIYRYDSLKSFNNGGQSTSFTLPSSSLLEGTGGIAYNASVYYHTFQRYSSSGVARIARFDMDNPANVLVRSLPRGSLQSPAGNYKGVSYSAVDFAADEYGLWVIYASTSNNNFMVVSRLNPETLVIEETHNTNYPKSSVSNCFIICKIMYCLDNYNSATGKIFYSFNIGTGVESFSEPGIPFANRFISTVALNYNAFDQKLYGYDNGHLTIYDLTFFGRSIA